MDAGLGRKFEWRNLGIAALSLGIGLMVGCETAEKRDCKSGTCSLKEQRGQAPSERPPVTPTIEPVVAKMAEEATPQIRVVAVIGSDVFITDDEVWQMVRQRIATTPPDQAQRLTLEEQKARDQKFFSEELNNLIEREIILADFLGKLKKQKPQAIEDLKEESNRMAQRSFREYKRSNKLDTEEKLIKALQFQGMNYKLLLRQLERNAMFTIYMDTFLRDKGKGISAVEIAKYYEEHAEEFRTEDKLKWLDLFVSHRRFNTPGETKQYAEWLHKQAVANADFVELVKKHGHGDSPLRGGVGLGSKPQDVQPAELAPQVLALQTGQVSEIIATETGYHILKMAEREIAGVRPFDEKTQTFIRRKLTGLLQEREKDKLVEELRRKTTVRIIE
ncbi:MAG: peptidylprolyl isomerase [Fimbriiglobus sp.]